MSGLKIGELAKIAGVPAGTIRYYERIGLIPAPPRSGAGYRRYSPAALERLKAIRRIKELGFTLKEISALLLARGGECGPCRTHQCRVAAKLREVEAHIERLHRVRASLEALLHGRSRDANERRCTLLSELDIDAGLIAALSAV